MPPDPLLAGGDTLPPTDGDLQPYEQATDELYVGMYLGEYVLEGPVAQGGMGLVYSAVHPKIGKRAAVKVLKKELCEDPFQLERFVGEARIVNAIGHPNIVDVFAFGDLPDGRCYFVMEWLRGETLLQRMRRQRLDIEDITLVVRGLSRALIAAHSKGVIHRDLKPDNVFLVEVDGEPPHVKLLDFGLAKLADAGYQRSMHTAQGAMVGTPQYMAPEQARGGAIDKRVDIYALGGILYELLTGRPPFVSESPMEMIAKHITEPVVPPSTYVEGLSPELDELVVSMLAKEPDGRPTLVEVFEVVERIRQQHPSNVITHMRLDAAAAAAIEQSGANPLVVRFAEKAANAARQAPRVGTMSTPAILAIVFVAMIASAIAMYFVMRAIA